MKLISRKKLNPIILVIALTMSMCFTGFSAIVSDNDGSAFITKAEFDSLKNDFQSQLDSYNTSIDSKIDSAIAGYLAGINVAKRIDLVSSLDNDGKFRNGIALNWSSSTSGYFGDTSGERIAIETFTMYYDDTNKTGWVSGGYQFKERTKSVPTVAARKYLTSKEVKTKLDDGTEIKSQTRMKVRCNLIWWWEEWQPVGSLRTSDGWTPYSPARLGGNSAKVMQNTRELYIYNSAGYQGDPVYGAPWIGTGGITTETKDIADDNESYTYDELMCPLSTTNEYVWDPLKNDVSVTQYGSAEVINAWTGATNLNWRRYHIESWFSVKSFSSGGPVLTDGWKVPWMKQTRKVQDMYLTNLINIDNRHRQVKNGLIISDTDKKGDYSLKVSATEAGKLYVYIGSTPISNWTSTSFIGKTYDIAEANKSYTFKWEKVTEEKKPIWICYLPTSTTNVGRLKVESVFYETEQ